MTDGRVVTSSVAAPSVPSDGYDLHSDHCVWVQRYRMPHYAQYVAAR